MKRKKNRSALRMLALISQLGICMLTSIFICVFLGGLLVRVFHQELLFPLMLMIGILAGMRSCHRLIQSFIGEGESEYHETDKMDKRNK